MDYRSRIIDDIETLSLDGIRECFDNGISPNDYHNNKPLIEELITEYGRGTMFSRCVQLFIDYGLNFTDEALLAVLSDNAVALSKAINTDHAIISRTYSFRCAFTPLQNVSLLHICAEYNHVSCASVLLENGMDVNIKAGTDEYGFGEHTPIFHTVNQHANLCIDMMRLLLSKGADCSIAVKGLIWGKGYPWETFVPAVNPISYAMMGLLRQFQRSEENVYAIVSELMKSAYGIDYKPANIPNAYLRS